jgi:hypothetical protein
MFNCVRLRAPELARVLKFLGRFMWRDRSGVASYAFRFDGISHFRFESDEAGSKFRRPQIDSDSGEPLMVHPNNPLRDVVLFTQQPNAVEGPLLQ